MKKITKLLGVSSLMLGLALASCAKDPSEVVTGYDTAIETTVKLTYDANYNVDVDANGGTGNMDSFKHQIRANHVVEMDLGSDLYIKVTKTKQDLLVSQDKTVFEYLLYKDADGKYWYETSSDVKVEVKEKVAEKVAEIFETATYEQAGGLSLDSLLYNSLDKEYELANFGYTETFMTEDLVDPSYDVKDDCLTVTYKPEYVGYRTDGGWSDFSNAEAGHAAVCTIVTNNKGQVVSWNEQYNTASLDFAIMTPAPTVVITGERKFTAEYGVTLTKVSEVAKTPAVVTYGTATNGTFEVKAFTLPQTFEALASGSEVALTKYIAIKPAAAEGYEVDKVSVNDVTDTAVPVQNAGGWYCFTPKPGKNEVVVTFKASDAPVVKTTVTYASSVAGGTFEVKAFTLPQTFEDLASGGEIAEGKFIAVKPVAAEGYTMKSVSVNGSTTTAAVVAGWYCFTPTAGDNQVLVEFEKTTPAGNHVVYDQVEGGTISVSAFTLNGFVFTPLADGDTLPEGQYVAVKPVAAEGYVVKSVSVNGVTETVLAPADAGGWYCFTQATGANTITVVFEAAQ